MEDADKLVMNYPHGYMKKICYVTTVAGTIRPFLLGIADYLQKTGNYEVSFICDFDRKLYNDIPVGSHYYPVKMKRGIDISGLKAIYEMYRIFKRENFDLVQYSTPNASFYASIASKLAHVPVRLYCQWGIAYVGFSGLKRRIFKNIEKIVCRFSTWVEPDSKGNLKFSHDEHLYDRNIGSVIWNGSANGVDLQKFDIMYKATWRTEIRNKYRIPDNSFTYIFIGRITRDKGINELFEATKKMMIDYEEVYLLIVGSNDNQSSLNQELYEWANSSQRVIFCGTTREVEKYLSASDVYILPSYREGFGTAVIEAEAMGVPVIVTDIPGPTDAMIDGVTGVTVKKKDPDSLLSAMKMMIENSEKLFEMGEAGHLWVKNNFEQLILYSKILEDRDRLIDGTH